MFFAFAYPAFADEETTPIDCYFTDSQTDDDILFDRYIGDEDINSLHGRIVDGCEFPIQLEYPEYFDNATTNVIEPFNLASTTTRGRAAAYIVMARNFNLLTSGSLPSNRFDDVPMSSWYFPAITQAANQRWVLGLAGTNRFNPIANVTRQEFAVMLVRAFSTPLHSGTQLNQFSDRDDIASWAVPYVRRAVERGWILGFPNGTFRPTNNITRQDAITMTNRAPGRDISDPTIRTVFWNQNSGSNVADWQRAQGHAIGPLPTTSWSGRRFEGWFTTSALSGGTQVRTTTIVPGNNLTYWARWSGTTTMNYNVLVRTTALTPIFHGFLNDIKPAFRSTFDINLVRHVTTTTSLLNQRTGCGRAIDLGCNRNCGTPLSTCRTVHHRSANHFVNVGRGTMARPNFKFVDYRLCSYRGNGEHLDVVNGAANRISGDTIIVSSRSPNQRRTTAHEISHLFGAEDDGCSDTLCVMTYGAPTHSQWCDNHRNQIMANRNR